MKKKLFLFINCDKTLLQKAETLIQKEKNLQMVSLKKKKNSLYQIWKTKPDAVFCEYQDTFQNFFTMAEVSFSEKLIQKKHFFTFIKDSHINDLLRLQQNHIPHIYTKSEFAPVFSKYISELRS